MAAKSAARSGWSHGALAPSISNRCSIHLRSHCGRLPHLLLRRRHYGCWAGSPGRIFQLQQGACRRRGGGCRRYWGCWGEEECGRWSDGLPIGQQWPQVKRSLYVGRQSSLARPAGWQHRVGATLTCWHSSSSCSRTAARATAARAPVFAACASPDSVAGAQVGNSNQRGRVEGLPPTLPRLINHGRSCRRSQGECIEKDRTATRRPTRL